MGAAGSWAERPAGENRPGVADTKMSGEAPQLHPCFPLQKFPALSLMRSFPPECPLQLPWSSAHLAVPSQPLHRSPRCSAVLQGSGDGDGIAELVPVSLSPLQPPLHAAAERAAEGGRAAAIAADSGSPEQLRSFASGAKAPGLANSGRQEPGAALPWEHGEANPAGLSPCRHIRGATATQGCPQHCPATPGPPGSYLRWWWPTGRQPS